MEFYSFQKKTIKKIIEQDAVWVMFDMGLGKTATTLKALEEVKNNYFIINKILIVAPKQVALNTWEQEAKKFGINLRFSQLAGKNAKEREKAMRETADVYLFNFELLPWVKEYIEKNKKGADFDCLVIDEASKIKDAKTQRFKSLRHLIKNIKKKILLTGTPAPNGYIDLWPQAYVLDSGKRLESFKGRYLSAYFIPDKRRGSVVFSYRLRPHGAGEIQDKIRDLCVVGGKNEYEEIYKKGRPKLIKNNYIVEADTATLNLYKTLKNNYVVSHQHKEIIAETPAVLVNKLRQICGGAIYENENHNALFIHRHKATALVDIIEKEKNNNILIYYNFIFERDIILEALKNYNVKEYSEEVVEEWNNKKIRILLAQPLKMSHGVNLQYGGAVVVWYSLTYSLETYMQANARLYRQGQERDVVCYHLLIKDTIDEEVVKILRNKEEQQRTLLESLTTYWQKENKLTTTEKEEIDKITEKIETADTVLKDIMNNIGV